MKSLFFFFFTKITLFSVLGIITIAVTVTSFIVEVILNRNEIFVDQFMLIGLLFLVLVLLLDRILVQYIRALYLSIFETIFLIAFIFIFKGLALMAV